MQRWKIVTYVVLVVALTLLFLLANLTNIVSGGWLSLLIAAGVITLMTTWRHGASARHEKRLDVWIYTTTQPTAPRAPPPQTAQSSWAPTSSYRWRPRSRLYQVPRRCVSRAPVHDVR